MGKGKDKWKTGIPAPSLKAVATDKLSLGDKLIIVIIFVEKKYLSWGINGMLKKS